MARTRREFSAKTRVAAFERCQGLCESCGVKVSPGKFSYDHILPDALGGDRTLENCQVLCQPCHDVKTATQDVPRIKKAERQLRNHIAAAVESNMKIKSRGFAKADKPKREPLQVANGVPEIARRYGQGE